MPSTYSRTLQYTYVMVICGKCLRRPVYSKCFISIQKSQHDAAWSILPFRFVHSHRSHAPESCPVFYAEPDLSARDASNPESLTSGPILGWVYHPSHPSNWQRKMRTGPLVSSGKTESRVRCVEACYDHLVKQTCMFQVDLPRLELGKIVLARTAIMRFTGCAQV